MSEQIVIAADDSTDATEQTDVPEGFTTITDATDEDLNAFIAGEHAQQAEQQPQTAPQPEKQTVQETAPPAPTQPPAKEVSQEEHEKLRKRFAATQAYVQRRSQEIGELRKQLRAANEQLKAKLDERFVESPSQALQDAETLKDNERNLEALDREETHMKHVVNAQQVVANHIKPDEMSMDDMAQSLRDDGIAEEYVSAFKANPYGSAMPETIIQLAKRARAEKLAKVLAGYLENALKKIETLEGKPKEVLRNVQSALSKSPQMTAATGGSTNGKSNGRVNPASMSNAEIEDFLKSATD